MCNEAMLSWKEMVKQQRNSTHLAGVPQGRLLSLCLIGLLNIVKERGNGEKARVTEPTFLVYHGFVQQPERRQGSARNGCRDQFNVCSVCEAL